MGGLEREIPHWRQHLPPPSHPLEPEERWRHELGLGQYHPADEGRRLNVVETRLSQEPSETIIRMQIVLNHMPVPWLSHVASTEPRTLSCPTFSLSLITSSSAPGSASLKPALTAVPAHPQVAPQLYPHAWQSREGREMGKSEPHKQREKWKGPAAGTDRGGGCELTAKPFRTEVFVRL